MIGLITSIHNAQVKNWKRLHKRKYREKMQRFLIEGDHLIEAARESDWSIQTVILREGTRMPNWCTSQQLAVVGADVFNEISQTETPQGIAAVVEMKKQTPTNDADTLLIDAVQDPGNLGTIIRTADAAGFTSIYLGQGTVDVYNEKVVRASQGSLFHVDIQVNAKLEEVIPTLQKQGYTVWASTLEDATSLYEIKPSGKTAIILGNEGAGVQKHIVSLADKTVKIPIYGKAESLNVSIAAGILMYHVRK
jgi:TrmH family RNA methyltransferase